MTLTKTLTFNPLRAMAMTYSRAKVQDQRSVGSEDRVEKTDGQTDGGDCITSLTSVRGKYLWLTGVPLIVQPIAALCVC